MTALRKYRRGDPDLAALRKEDDQCNKEHANACQAQAHGREPRAAFRHHLRAWDPEIPGRSSTTWC